MRLGNVGYGLDFCHLQGPQIGLPVVELVERIMVGAEVVWQPALTSNGAQRKKGVRLDQGFLGAG